MREADVVIGYGPYVDQCADLLDGQEVIRGRMGEELERAREAVERARAVRGRAGLLRRRRRARHGRADARHGVGDRRDGDPGRHRRARRRRAPGRAARRRLGDALAVGPAPPVGDRRAAPDRARRLRDRARALQPALEDPHGAVRARAGDPARAPRRRTRPWRSRPTSRREGETITHATLATLDPATVTMRSLCSCAGESRGVGRARGSSPRERGRAAPATRPPPAASRERRRDRPPRRRRPRRSRAAHGRRRGPHPRARACSSMTGRRWTRSSRSPRPTPSVTASAARPGGAR